ncbi:MAG TPA: SAM-dependent methyltransferase [Candidatus Polarisedimenticolia bacterium]|nr:SAM-dependent methyltransferase [Candidatus Polarisedimenticolia bacterium]
MRFGLRRFVKKGRASSTAGVVASSLLFIHEEPDIGHLVPDGAAEMILPLIRARSPFRAAVLAGGLRRPWFRFIVRTIERMAIPGLMLHHVIRKRFIEDETRRALAEGASQVVVLGAGLDTLAFRLHREFPGTMFVELDHPATQDAKRRIFGGLTVPSGRNLKLLSADFTRQSADEILAACPGYDPNARTVLVMEGVLMYLSPGDVDRAFAAVRRCGGAGSRFVFTFMEIGPDGRPGFSRCRRAGDAWLAWKGEPFLWGLRPEALSGFLTQRGFLLIHLPTPGDLRRRYLANLNRRADLAEGERIGAAERT